MKKPLHHKKQVLWQDIIPIKKPKTPLEKLQFRLKRLQKKRYIAKINKINGLKTNHRPLKPAKKKTLITKKKLFMVLATCLIIIASFAIYKQCSTPKKVAVKVETIKKADKPTAGTPTYKTLLPAGKNIKNLGGWVRISPSTASPVYAYVDKIGNTAIDVSEQPLPEDFKTDTDTQIEQLAQSFKATEKMSIGAYTVHIGTSAEGPQSVIFSRDNLLILIKSTAKVDNNSWAQYISSLQ